MNRLRNNKGFTVALVFGAIFIVLMVTMTLVMRLASHSSRVQKKLETEAARYWAEAALVHGMKMNDSATKVKFADGHYEVVAREEIKTGPLGQKIIHLVTQAVTNKGAHAGCLYTYERYPTGMTVPLYFNRFARKVDLKDSVTVRQLIKGELITKREVRLRKKYHNLQAEMAITRPDYEKALLELTQTMVDVPQDVDWDEALIELTKEKMN